MERYKGHARLAVGMLLIAVAAMAFACGDDDDDSNGGNGANGGEGAPTAVEVSVLDNSFSPARATIAVGGTVTWTWSGEFPHSVSGTFAGEPVMSETLTGTGSFEFTFDEAGTFSYQCGVHGDSMAGTIVVEA